MTSYNLNELSYLNEANLLVPRINFFRLELFCENILPLYLHHTFYTIFFALQFSLWSLLWVFTVFLGCTYTFLSEIFTARYPYLDLDTKNRWNLHITLPGTLYNNRYIYIFTNLVCNEYRNRVAIIKSVII